jgi:uncharacterized protein YqjF (DUF2071 family)
MTQTWFDLLFIHWPISTDLLRPLIPSFLEIDTFDRTGWIGVIPLGMKNIHFRNLPPIPFTSAFLELNVRTYVRWQGKAGVYFFSLDATNPMAVEVARRSYFLPYFHARIKHSLHGKDILYRSERVDWRSQRAVFEAIYRSISEPRFANKGSLEEWLTERYCLMTSTPKGKPVIAEIHHKPWPLQDAQALIRTNSVTEVLGIHLPDTEPILHFARELETLEWASETFNN